MKDFLAWIIKRGAEASTLRGVVGVATAIAVAVNPDNAVAMLAAGTGVIGLINTIRQENKNDAGNNV